MPQVLTQTQTQKTELQLRLSLQQLQLVKLLEMPIAEFEQQIKKEVVENPALEEGHGYESDDRNENDVNSSDENDINDTGIDEYSEPADDNLRKDIDEELSSYGDNDDLPVYKVNNGTQERADIPLGDTVSFIEYLEDQMMNYDLDETQQKVMRYLIGSLDNRGFIERPIPVITDELSFNEYLDVTEDDVLEVMRVLQSFDPPGIGARNTQECLLLQIDRLLNGDEPISELKEKILNLERNVVADYYDLFLNKNKERLKSKLKLSEVQIEAVFQGIKKLNVNPGFALSESSSDRVSTQIPDFIVETDPDGGIEMHLNSGDIPRLHVRQDYLDQLKMFQAKPNKMTRSEKEGMMYTRQKVEAAQMFIESVKQRRRTLYETMKAIIELQRTFFITKDENDKVRLVLEDVAKKAGYDVSTVSRVCKTKCAQVDGRIFPLSDFFKLTRKNAEGNEVDSKVVGDLLMSIVNSEDKQNPYTDDKIVEIMSRKGVKLARRTVAKYRQQLGVPSVTNRKA